jgi:hypothetical protein
MSDMRALVERQEESGNEAGTALSKLALGGIGDLERIRATTDWEDPKARRLIVDVALGAIRSAIKLDEAQMRGRQTDRLGELLEQVRQAKVPRIEG